jgi:predicted nuclease of predicted toxin-antitoxin system
MLKFLIDTQLPPKLSRFFRDKGFNAIHTTHFENGHLFQDFQIIDISIKEQRIIITKDSDFFDNFILKGSPPKVLLLQVGNISNIDLIELFEKYFNKIVDYFNNDFDLIILHREGIVAY